MVKFSRMIETVDSHTGGQPTRTIIAGLPVLKGNNMTEKMVYMKEHEDWVRTFFTSEPRGTKLSSVAVLTEPVDREADIGAFFFESCGYMAMCGHDTIGISTVLAETGKIGLTEPKTELIIDTPNGLIRVQIAVKDGKVKNVTFRNTPSFAFGFDMEIEYMGRSILFDVGYGGNFFAIFKTDDFDFRLVPEEYKKIVETAGKLLELVNQAYEIIHPENTFLKGVTHVMFADRVRSEGEKLVSRNAVVYMSGEIDRSPCGTGTSARTAVLYARGVLRRGQIFENHSIIDSVFQSVAVDTLSYCGYDAVIPEITGSAHITGFGLWVLDPEDDKAYGFQLDDRINIDI